MEDMKKVKKAIYDQNGNTNKEVENLKGNKINLELKSIISEILKIYKRNPKADLNRHKKEPII